MLANVNKADYGVEFGFENYEKMTEIMRSMKGKMVVTVNDIPEMRECFGEFILRNSKSPTPLERSKIGGEIINLMSF